MTGGSAAKLQIMEVAERLFAERGINGVSLRELGAAAGQRNTAAVRYHFGSKQGLVNAIFEYRMRPINARRLALVAELDAQGLGESVRGLAAAFLFPLSDMLGEDGSPGWYLRFCTQVATMEGLAVHDLGAQEWTEGIHVVRSRLLNVLRSLPAEVAALRWHLFAGYIINALADRELGLSRPGSDGFRPRLHRSLFVANVLETSVALLVAPPSESAQTNTAVLGSSASQGRDLAQSQRLRSGSGKSNQRTARHRAIVRTMGGSS